MIGNGAFVHCEGLTSLTIPNSVTHIFGGTFAYCVNLVSLTIGNSVTSIGRDAFAHCYRLTSVTIPNSVTWIGGNPFPACTNLNSIEVSSGNTVYDSRENCNAIVETTSNTLISSCINTTIPNSVTSIGDYAFFSQHLTSLTIPNSVTSIGDHAFHYCSSLREINCLSATAPTLGNYAFGQVDNTIPVNIPCGSMASYQSEWSYFSNFNEVFSTYTLDVYSSDEAMGSASITTLPNCNDNTAVVEATAHAGYRFDHWSDGSTANPYTVQLTDNTTLIAHFSANTGIEEMDDSGILVYVKDHQIHIDAAIGETVNVYTIDGRTLATMPKATEHVAFPVTTAGVYLVKIGHHSARKVVVIW